MFKLYRYKIPFKKPFITGAGTYNFREGIILRFRDSKFDLVSEAAPLPGFSKETLKNSLDELIDIQHETDQFFSQEFDLEELNAWLNYENFAQSVAFGLSSLGLLILASRSENDISDIFGITTHSPIKVNAVISSSTEADFFEAVEQSIKSGFTEIKCKVTSDPGHLPNSIKKIAEQYPLITFRLDANRSWDRKKLQSLSARFSGLPIDYIEEPSPADTIKDLVSIIRESELPVALDESLFTFGLMNIIEALELPPYLIIKPMMFGNLIELFATIRNRYHLENRVIVTTSLESALGVNMVAQVAALIGKRSSAHGLSTGNLFQQNLFNSDAVDDGTYRFDQDFKSYYTFARINQSLITPV